MESRWQPKPSAKCLGGHSVTDKIWPLVEEWQSRPLEETYAVIFLDAINLTLRRDGKVAKTPVYNVLGVNLAGQRDILGHWCREADGAEGANLWLSVLTDLQTHGVKDVFIACVDGLTGFPDAIQSVFPRTVVHQIRNSLKYTSWKDRKAFAADLKTIYQAATREQAEANLRALDEKWSSKYAVAVRSWQNNWDNLSTFFEFALEIRRLIYTTNSVEGRLRRSPVAQGDQKQVVFPVTRGGPQVVIRQVANQNITVKWTMPIQNWVLILNHLAIRFEDRFPV